MSELDDAVDRAEEDAVIAGTMGFHVPGEMKDRIVLAAEVRRLRKGVAAVASRLIDGLLSQRLEDGTPTLELVLAQNPELAARLRAALIPKDAQRD